MVAQSESPTGYLGGYFFIAGSPLAMVTMPINPPISWSLPEASPEVATRCKKAGFSHNSALSVGGVGCASAAGVGPVTRSGG